MVLNRLIDCFIWWGSARPKEADLPSLADVSLRPTMGQQIRASAHSVCVMGRCFFCKRCMGFSGDSSVQRRLFLQSPCDRSSNVVNYAHASHIPVFSLREGCVLCSGCGIRARATHKKLSRPCRGGAQVTIVDELTDLELTDGEEGVVPPRAGGALPPPAPPRRGGPLGAAAAPPVAAVAAAPGVGGGAGGGGCPPAWPRGCHESRTSHLDDEEASPLSEDNGGE